MDFACNKTSTDISFSPPSKKKKIKLHFCDKTKKMNQKNRTACNKKWTAVPLFTYLIVYHNIWYEFYSHDFFAPFFWSFDVILVSSKNDCT